MKLQATWTAAENALPFMSKRDRNSLFKEVMEVSLTDFQREFVPKRFTTYVERKPFGYSMYSRELQKAMAALGVNKDGTVRPGVGGHGALHDAVSSILRAETGGWNPWGSAPPSEVLKQEWREANKKKYKFSFTGNWGGMIADMRKHFKARILSMFKNLYHSRVMLPLVLTGDTRSVSMNGKVRAHQSGGMTVGKVPVPFAGPRHKRVGLIISMVPIWEADYITRRIERHFQDRLASIRRSSQVRWGN